MIIVTGGAGFIGSALIHGLNQRGDTNILVVDKLNHPAKKRNLSPLKFIDRVSIDKFIVAVKNRSLEPPRAILHMGACSSTTETNCDFLRTNNFEYTQELAKWALESNIRFIYASSAATYGGGVQGYSDDESQLEFLRPLNPYGESKHQFDLWAKSEGVLNDMVGLKYFNAYGPNEYHKEDMQSMIRKGFLQIRESGKLRLFKSHKPEYSDGGQVRDFIYIKDAVAMTLHFLDHPEVNGIYNIGTGQARNWNDLAKAIFAAMDLPPNIEYIDMPETIRDHYQYHTRADTKKLRSIGAPQSSHTLETGIEDYVQNYLLPEKHLGE